MRQKRVDGFIIAAAYDDDKNVLELVKSGVPVVLLEGDIDCDAQYVDRVLSNNFKGGYIATKHLTDLGHRDIACLLGPSRMKVNLEREQGYFKAMKEAGIGIKDEFVAYGEIKIEFGFEKAIEMFSYAPKPSAFFVANDLRLQQRTPHRFKAI
ncbi:MAG: LacI family transcriptional regulator [Tepidanaerobacteraceae bacterium]|nr:LacI family transcriptional regulator [Tepidanaerobacteraceae bacterium]